MHGEAWNGRPLILRFCNGEPGLGSGSVNYKIGEVMFWKVQGQSRIVTCDVIISERVKVLVGIVELYILRRNGIVSYRHRLFPGVIQ